MKKVTLYDYKGKDIKINITAYFTEEDHLIIDGYDIGKSVKEMMGDSDYEYSITVKKENINSLNLILKCNTENLLLIIKEKFNGNYAFSSFRDFLKENEIPFTDFYWR